MHAKKVMLVSSHLLVAHSNVLQALDEAVSETEAAQKALADCEKNARASADKAVKDLADLQAEKDALAARCADLEKQLAALHAQKTEA